MTSKNSFWKLSNWNFKKRAWTLALCSVIWFFVLPVSVFMQAGGLLQGMEYLKEAERQSQLLWTRSYVINHAAGNTIALIAVVGMAFLLALQGFAWNNHQKKVDFYKSVPVKENTRFWYINLNSLWIFFISVGANMLLANAAAAVKGIWSGDFALALAVIFLMYLLLFASSYFLVLIAQSLTGNVVLGFCGASVLLAVEPALLLLRDGLMQTFYKTYFGESMYQVIGRGIFTPLSVFVRMYKEVSVKSDAFANTANFGGIWIYMLILLLQIAVFGAAAYALYRKRPAQTGGKSMVFPKTKPVIKTIIMIMGSLYLAVFMATTTDQDNMVWYGLFGAVCGLLILQVVLQTIMEGNFKEALGGKISFAAAAGVILIIYFVHACDLTGFDTWLPDSDRVESFAFVRDRDYYYSFYDKDGSYQSSQDYLMENMQIDDPQLKEELLSMLALAIQNGDYYYQGDNYSEKSYSQGTAIFEDGGEQETVCVKFRLSNGKEVKRSYCLKLDAIRSYWVNLYELPEYKQSIYMLLQDSTKTWFFGDGKEPGVSYYTYNLGTSDSSSKGAALVEELFEAMKKDVLNRTSHTVMAEVPVGRLEFSTIWDDSVSEKYINLFMVVYESDRSTIEILKREGWYQEAGIGKDEVNYIDVYQSVDDGEHQKVMRLEKDDPLFETVRESLFITEVLQDVPDAGAVQKHGYWAEIGIRGASGGSTSYWFTGTFYADKFPEELEKAFEDIEVEDDEEY